MSMIKPFYQGKLDTFCAIYAVLNALRLLRGLRTLKAREILNDTLLELCCKPAQFVEVLNQSTDYLELVDAVLTKYAPKFSVSWHAPFAEKKNIGQIELWDIFRDWLGHSHDGIITHTIIFRFLKFVRVDGPALNRHWTTVEYATEDYIHLFDCSHEAEAILNIKKDAFVSSASRLDKEHLIVIPPEYVRFLSIGK